MQAFRSFLCLLLILAVLVGLLQATGCAKEYSYERKPVDTVTINNPLTSLVSSCALCNSNVLPDSSWQFVMDGVLYCGKAEKTIITLERTTFTFFGPSACSIDSGFVATVLLDANALNSDKTNLQAKLACYYYDKVKPSYMFMSNPGQYLQFIISSYVHQTGVATGTFSGSVSTENGIRKEVRDGRFRIRF